MGNQALEGLKVLELCNLVSGPYCSKILGDLGAEVVKIEEPCTGDKARRRGPFMNNIPHPERSGLFLYLNINKLGVTLNLKTQTGRKIFHDLVKETDILIEDNPPQLMKDWGLDYDNLKKINPSLIMTSVTPFGQRGPHSNYKAYDLNTYFGSGLLYKGEEPGSNPMPAKGGKFFGDYLSGLNAVMATLGALYACGTSGKGQGIDISKQESLIALLRVSAAIYPNEGINEIDMSKLRSAMGGLRRCKDGHVIFTNAEEHHWKGFVRLMDDPEWANDPDLKNIFQRAQNMHKFEHLIDEWMMRHTRDEIFHKGQNSGCPVAMVSTIDDVAKSEQIKDREFFVEIEHKETGKLKYPQAPYRHSKTPWTANRSAPLLGEHNEEIYCNRLGYSKEDLVKFAESGVI